MPEIKDYTEKTTAVDADLFIVSDSAASNALKKLSFLNLKLVITNWNNPVGTIREFNVATNPATLLGFGTWVAHGSGRVTVAIDAGQTEFDVLGETGGAKTHTLSVGEMPSHNHIPANGGVFLQHSAADANLQALVAGTTTGGGSGATTGGTGGGAAHNNLQPYVVVYRWVRTA